MTTVRKQYASEVIADGSGRRLTFKISTGALDRDRDRIDPAGWDISAYLKNPVVCWAHKYDELPIAKCVDLRAAPDALRATAEFATHELAENVFQLYKGGFLSAVSVGFIPIEQEPNADGGHDITRAELLEFSGVAVPSNEEALLIAAAKGLALEVVPEGDVQDALAGLLAPFDDPVERLLLSLRDEKIQAAFLDRIGGEVERVVRVARGRLPD